MYHSRLSHPKEAAGLEDPNKQVHKKGFEFAKREFIEHQNKQYVINFHKLLIMEAKKKLIWEIDYISSFFFRQRVLHFIKTVYLFVLKNLISSLNTSSYFVYYVEILIQNLV